MENSGSEDTQKKRSRLDSLSPTMARNSSISPPNSKTVDAAVLQNQNQKLVQQLDVQKQQLQELETNMKDLHDKQTYYDDVLITVNQLWNQLVDDLVLLGIRAGADNNGLEILNHADQYRGSIPSCSPEEMFLCRLLQKDTIEPRDSDKIVEYVQQALASRHSFTMGLIKNLEDAIATQRAENDSMALAFCGKRKLSSEEAVIFTSKIEDMMKAEAKNLRKVINILHLKHKEYSVEIQAYIDSHPKNQLEIKRLAGELEETMAELEESRRKLVNLKMQKDAASALHTPSAGASPGAVNGNLSPEKPADKATMREFKDSIEETKMLAEDRLSELQDSQGYNKVLSKQLQELQNDLKDDKYVHNSRLYNLVNDQLQHWNAELERYKALCETLQAERTLLTRKEKELSLKAESADSARNTTSANIDSKVERLELQLQGCIDDKNSLEIKMEEAIQDAGRKDIKTEFRVMASALSKEMGMMETQLSRWKETAQEALSLREEALSLKARLRNKTNEQQGLVDRCDEQMVEMKSLKALIEKMQKEKFELQIILDMYGKEGTDNRDLMTIRESERRAHSQAEVLQNALDEHSLELRVKAANEAEAACEQRLSAAEAEIAELREKVDASERDVLELTEAIKNKDREAEAYISEIETIGQAYEDMQMQNQHLLQQVAERDDYNLKLVSESVKTKQSQGSLLAEKQALENQLKQVKASLGSFKMRISHSEEQMKNCLSEALKHTQGDIHTVVKLETAKWELADAEKELKWLKSAIASSEKEKEQTDRIKEELLKELECERNENKKLDEELEEVNREIEELEARSGEAYIQQLQDDINKCKNILKCGVCVDRPKEVVITKCYHLFCNQCIQRNLELRHRKCPGCGTAFGQSDIRFVNL